MANKFKAATDPDPEDDGKHRSQETRRSCPDDMRLRDAGFAIYRRPKNAEPLWIRGHQVYTQTEAFHVINRPH